MPHQASPPITVGATQNAVQRMIFELSWRSLLGFAIHMSTVRSCAPRLVAGTTGAVLPRERKRWADALRDADADVVMNERAGSHDGAF